MTKRFFTIILILGCLPVFLIGQQEGQFTQFMYYKMGINPAYAGSDGTTAISLIGRQQWIGLEGAPQAQLLTFNMPLFNERVGIGASILRNTIGITDKYTAEASYAYRIGFGRGHLCLGLQGAIRYLQVDFSKASSIEQVDEAIPVGIQSRYVPNFGAGVFYDGHTFFIGLSVPRLLATNIDFSGGVGEVTREVQHIYFMTGMKAALGDNVVLQPQLLLKYVLDTPLFDADLNFNFIFAEQFILGASYRLGGDKINGIGDSVSGIIGFELNKSFQLTLAYDMGLSRLRDYNSGTVEAVISYFIGGKSSGDDFQNPRDFRFF